jgi:hypothetical protein
MQNPNSNLEALNCAYEYLLPIQMFHYGVLQIRICCIDQAFVNHLHSCCRKGANKQPAVHPIMQQPEGSKKLLAKIDFLDYLLYDAYSNHVTASESFSIMNG